MKLSDLFGWLRPPPPPEKVETLSPTESPDRAEIERRRAEEATQRLFAEMDRQRAALIQRVQRLEDTMDTQRRDYPDKEAT